MERSNIIVSLATMEMNGLFGNNGLVRFKTQYEVKCIGSISKKGLNLMHESTTSPTVIMHQSRKFLSTASTASFVLER